MEPKLTPATASPAALPGNNLSAETTAESIVQILGGPKLDLSSAPSGFAEDMRVELEAHCARYADQFSGAVYLDPATIAPFFRDQQANVSISNTHYQKIFGADAVWFGDSSIYQELKERDDRLKGAIYGTTPAREASCVLEIARAIKPRVVLVVGTHLGIQSADILKHCPEHTLVFSLDIKPSWIGNKVHFDTTNRDYVEKVGLTDEKVGEEIEKLPIELRRRHFQFFGTSNELKETGKLFSAFSELVDLVIVDGNHRFQTALEDLFNATHLLAPGGVITVDDYMKPPRLLDVTTAVNLLATSIYNNGDPFKVPGLNFSTFFQLPDCISDLQAWWINGFDKDRTPAAEPTFLALFTRAIE